MRIGAQLASPSSAAAIPWSCPSRRTPAWRDRRPPKPSRSANALIMEISMPHIAPRIELPGAVIGHQPCGMDFGRGVGDPPLDRLSLGQRLAEGRRAAAHIRTSCRARAAPCRSTRPPSRRGASPAESASARSRLPFACRAASSLRRGNPPAPSHMWRAADHRNAPQDLEAGRALVDEKRRDAATRRFSLLVIAMTIVKSA